MSDFVTVAKTADVPAGKIRVVEAKGVRVALCNVDGRYYAVEDRCTHDNGPLGEGGLEGEEIECPRHGARFDVKSGQVTCLPAVKPIKTYPLQVVGDEIQLAVSE